MPNTQKNVINFAPETFKFIQSDGHTITHMRAHHIISSRQVRILESSRDMHAWLEIKRDTLKKKYFIQILWKIIRNRDTNCSTRDCVPTNTTFVQFNISVLLENRRRGYNTGKHHYPSLLL